MTGPVHQQHHDIALMAASAAKDRCGGDYSMSMAMQGGRTGGLSPSSAAAAVTDAYKAALASLSPPPVKAPRKTAPKIRR